MIPMSCKTRGGGFRSATWLFWGVVGLGSLISDVSIASGASDIQCSHHTSDRQAFFGDLHIHTGVSADAMLFGTRNRPDDAYAFARGKEIFVFQEKMTPAEPLPAQIERPLDFAAVTDHAENIGTVSLCMRPGSDVYDSEDCRYVRRPLPMDDMAAFASELAKVFHLMYRSEVICGADRKRCIEAVQDPWNEIQTAAHQWNLAASLRLSSVTNTRRRKRGRTFITT